MKFAKLITYVADVHAINERTGKHVKKDDYVLTCQAFTRDEALTKCIPARHGFNDQIVNVKEAL